MTEPSEEERERAERIRKLRSGGAVSRGHEIRQRRRERADEDAEPTAERDATASDASAGEDAGGNEGGNEDVGGDDEADAGNGAGGGAMPAAGDADVLSMAADLPEDGSLFVVPVREDLRRQFNRVAEQLHLRYGFQYRSELDAETHVRPLALYLGIQALEDGDVDAVKELLESVDVLEAPRDGEV